jgi:predicted DNA-binding ribbon-helix-helix protein
MATEKSKEKESHPGKSDEPKYRQLVRMLSFRIVPHYYKKIERVADDQNTTVSALIRKYIKDGMIKDLEMKGTDTDFRIE